MAKLAAVVKEVRIVAALGIIYIQNILTVGGKINATCLSVMRGEGRGGILGEDYLLVER